MTRRQFLELAGAAGAAAAASGCSRGGHEQLVPYLVPIEGVQPGVSTPYATVCRQCPAGCGMIASVRDGRCHMVRGNPDHPVNSGGLCVRGYTSLQDLYHPDRYRQPMARDDHGRLGPISWDEAQNRLDVVLAGISGKRAAWIGQVETGAFDRLVDGWLRAVAPNHARLRYEAYSHEPLRAAAGRVWGKPVVPRFRIDRAKTLVCFGADFLETWISNVEFARDFAAWRAARREGKHNGRYVFVGPRLSLTGANADEWIAVPAGQEATVARALAMLMGGRPAEAGPLAERAGVQMGTLERLAREFRSGPSLALPIGFAQYGPDATDACEAILRLNETAGNAGRTVLPDEPHSLSRADGYLAMEAVIREMAGGGVAATFIHRANPAYNLPASAGFVDALRKVPAVVSFSSHPDETSALATLILPDHTPLESWGEYSPWPGVNGLQQPVVAPVFTTRATGDVLLASAARRGHSLGAKSFEDYLRAAHGGGAGWDAQLASGLAAGELAAPTGPPAKITPAVAAPATQAPAGGFRLQVYPSLHWYDGRTADRPWAQEIPDPVAKAVWDTWVEINPVAAGSMGLHNGDVVSVKSAAGRISAPALITDRVLPDVVAIQMGQGHTQTGRYARGVGVNPMALVPVATDPATGALVVGGLPVEVSKLPVNRALAVLQTTARQMGIGIARITTVAQAAWARRHAAGREDEKTEASLYHDGRHPAHHWNLAIDLDACVGCNACVSACYAENNVPIVGRDECARGREMSWLRIENYTEAPPGGAGLIQIRTLKSGPGARPLQTRFLPMLCQQCENAPCEYVCPVDATVHSDEGLNQQVYNRCVGTRYCSNNCPYKVRRFNWFQYEWPYPLDQQTNPDVTVRSKGVMEKCTFCVQRIRRAEIDAKKAKRPVADGEIQTACQQACPARAITFGDLKDPKSRVAALARDDRGYGALSDLNTFPNITYLARVRAE